MTASIGNAGYGNEADVLAERYESFSFADAHGSILHLLPKAPATVIDIGAGTGRDAAALVRLGYEVTAVEPTSELLKHATRLHPEPDITWICDGLPTLARVTARFDVVMITAVWMHLDEAQRAAAMRRVIELMNDKCLLTLTLRHGPVPEGRRMFEVSARETVMLATNAGLDCVLRLEEADGILQRSDVSWDRLAFVRTLR